jgi:hypothetical protein
MDDGVMRFHTAVMTVANFALKLITNMLSAAGSSSSRVRRNLGTSVSAFKTDGSEAERHSRNQRWRQASYLHEPVKAGTLPTTDIPAVQQATLCALV